MNDLYQRVAFIANICIIILSITLVGSLIQRTFFVKQQAAVQQPAQIQPVIGSKMSISDVNWSGQSKTLVLALQTTCHYCNESAPFYKRLIEETKGKNIKVLAVLPQTVEESAAHLKELGINGMEVKNSPLANIQVNGTPTLILTNDKGEITDFWIGKLTPGKEAEVINKLNS